MNRVCELLGIEYPVIQAGMVWCSGWELASAVSNAGGLGIIGAGSMYPEVLRTHIHKCKQATGKPFAVNLPLLYPDIEEHIRSITELEVPIVFTSAGNPAVHTAFLKEKGIKVVHVVSSSKFARKAMEAGCDAVVAEGFEAGGHNGREETTSMVLLPQVCNALEGKIPVIAAGGIAGGRAMAAAFCLGAEAVQMGTRFAATEESSAHIHYKQQIVQSREGDTVLTLKEVTPVRMFKNAFYSELEKAYQRGAGADELRAILGRGRSKKGVFEGDLEQGELEAGQVSSAITGIESAADVVKNTMNEFRTVLQQAGSWY